MVPVKKIRNESNHEEVEVQNGIIQILHNFCNSVWSWLIESHDKVIQRPPLNRVPLMRVEFMRAISDIDGEAAEHLRNRIALSRSMRDLYHCIPETRRIFSMYLSREESEQRVRQLKSNLGFAQVTSNEPKL